MILTEDTAKGQNRIQSFEPGQLTVNEQHYQHSLVLDTVNLQPWRPAQLDELQPDDWQSVIAMNPGIVLFGCGEIFKMPSPTLLAPLYQAGISVECMTTRAACYTFTALCAENRAVVAALLIH